MDVKKLFYELIQVSLGEREKLSHTPNDEEWQQIFLQANRRSVKGVTYHGIEILSKRNQKPPQALCYKWYLICENVKKLNVTMDDKSHKVLSMLSDAGIQGCLLKGQGIEKYYPADLRGLRQTGDIDVFANCSRAAIDAFARSQGQKRIEWNYKHLHLKIWKTTSVELHYHVGMLCNPFKNKELQLWFDKNSSLFFCEGNKFVAPSLSMNLFYSLLHLFSHIQSSRLGLKQVIDYYFLLRAANCNFGSFHDGESLEDVVRKYGMYRFARGMMWVLNEITGLDRHYMFCEPLENEGKFLLKEVFMADDGGYDSSREKPNLLEILTFIVKRTAHMLIRYPTEAFWVPLWYVWHKCKKDVIEIRNRNS